MLLKTPQLLAIRHKTQRRPRAEVAGLSASTRSFYVHDLAWWRRVKQQQSHDMNTQQLAKHMHSTAGVLN
jgi:hypothetical protein